MALQRLGALERMLGRPRANGALPEQIRLDEIIGWLDVDTEIAAIRSSIWEEAANADVNMALRILADLSPADE